MLKKVLFIVASLFVGLLLIISSLGSSFSQQVMKQSKSAVEANDYLAAERFTAYALDTNNIFYQNDVDGTHIEIFSSIAQKNIVETTGEGESATTTTYTVMQDCIQIALFNLPKDFALVDKQVSEGETPVRGGVTFALSDGSTFFMPFVDTTANYNYYNYIQYYSFLSNFVFYDDLVAKLAGNTVTSVIITDGNGVAHFTLTEFKKPISLDTNFHNEFHNLLGEYSALSLDYNAETDKEKKEEIYAQLEVKYKAIEDIANSDRYVKQHDVNIIYKSAGYIWSIVLTVIIFLAIDGLLGFLLFRKRKAPAYVPRRPMTYGQATNKPVSQPEQFSRKDVFDVEEGNFVIQENKEEKNNEESESLE